jgi:hypothetical protein
LRTAKKIGLTAFVISEVIIIFFAVMTLYKVSKDTAKISDMDTILYAQAAILTVTWGSQAGVNMMKNKNGVKE